MQPPAIVACSDDTRAKQLLQMMRVAGLPGKSVATVEELGKFRDQLAGQLVLYDLDSEGINPEELLQFATEASARVVVLMRQFDSKEWVSLFRAGAADILRYPVTPEQIEQVARGASVSARQGNGVRSGSDPISRATGWVQRAMLAGRRLLHL
jgi:DNA-binding NtrC family response regulator